MLATTQIDGPADTTPCVIAHGLYGSARNWGVIAKRMSQLRTMITVDMRNHGVSPQTETHSYPDMAGDLAEVIGAGHFDVIGHSMGGKAAMMLALNHPEKVRRLVVADIAPVTYTHSQLPFIHTMREVDLSSVTRRSQVAEQLGAMGVEPALQSFFTQSLDVAGKKWLYNLDTLERDMDKIMSFPDIEASFDGPTLFLTGADSDYVQQDHRPKIKSLFPKARFAKLTGAGHWLHADKPREFQQAVETFLQAPG